MSLKLFLRSFGGSIAFSIVGLAVSFWLGFRDGGLSAGLASLFLCGVLSVLEISLSFDNAVVNASVLERMSELWRRRFLTWGIIIAVFGMRLVLPLLIVAVLGKIGPIDALLLAINQPKDYARMMLSIHESVASFGGVFLFLVGITYFLDKDKDEHWLHWIEAPLAKLGRLQAIPIFFALTLLLVMTVFIELDKQMSFLMAGVAGVIVFVFVDGLGVLLGTAPTSENKARTQAEIYRASVGMFLYLEILDASFSFDGVVGAFALTHSLFLIAIGLGIGAMFVRSMTVLLVAHGTLSKFKYLEHGAFWAILSLSGLMLVGVFHHIPEAVTGICGAAIILMSMWQSNRPASAK